MKFQNRHILQACSLFAAFLFFYLITGCSGNDEPPPSPPDPDAVRRDSITNVLIKDLSSDSIKANIVWLESFGTRFALASNRKKVAESIRDRFIRYGFTDCRIDSFEVTLNYLGDNHLSWQYNVIARHHGDKYSDQFSIAGAHYDDIITSGDAYTNAPGANDNASGVALILEVARVMAKNNYVPWGNIDFVAFAAEEFDLQGSRHYVHDAFIHEDKILFMLNHDNVAYEPSTKIPTWQMNMAHYANSYTLVQEAITYCQAYSGLSPLIDKTNAKKSDSYSFFLGNLMALYFSQKQIDPNYHTVKDKSINLNFDYCREIAKVTCSMLVFKN
jgi:hypothetical protein